MRKWLKTSMLFALSLTMFAGCALPGTGTTSNQESASVETNNDYYTVQYLTNVHKYGIIYV
jgi:hypothetical protein